MRIFWWQHGLHLEPESQSEADMMVALVDSVKFGRPVSREQLPDLIIRDHEPVPSGLAGDDLNNQKTIS